MFIYISEGPVLSRVVLPKSDFKNQKKKIIIIELIKENTFFSTFFFVFFFHYVTEYST